MHARSSGKLKVTLPSDKEILLARVFDAPRALVFEAMTRPEHVRRWWCWMDGATMPVCEIDLRVGGKYRFVMHGAQCGEVAFHGEYLEVVRPERIVHTEVFEPFPDSPAHVTVSLAERDGKTHYQARVVHQTKEARDMHVQSGMEEGAGVALDLLEEIAQTLARRPGASAKTR
jgi:uncharacterized protein YndB with AHSA1/START domain